MWTYFVDYMTKSWSFNFEWVWGDHSPIDVSFGGATWMLYAGGLGALALLGIIGS